MVFHTTQGFAAGAGTCADQFGDSLVIPPPLFGASPSSAQFIFESAYPKHLNQLKREMHQNRNIINEWRFKILRAWAHFMMVKNRRFFPAFFVKNKVTLWSSIYAGRIKHQEKLSSYEKDLMNVENEIGQLAIKRSQFPNDLEIASQLRQAQERALKIREDAKKLSDLIDTSTEQIQLMVREYKEYTLALNEELDNQMTLYLRWKILSEYKPRDFPFSVSLPTVKEGKINETDVEIVPFLNPDRLEVTARSYEAQYKQRSQGLFSNFEMRQIVEKHTENHWALSILFEFLTDSLTKEDESNAHDQVFIKELAHLIDVTHERRDNSDPTFIKPSQSSQSRFAWKVAIEETKRFFSRIPPHVTKNYEDSLKSVEEETDIKEYSKRHGGVAFQEIKSRIKRFALASLLASSTITMYFTGIVESIQEYVEIPYSYISRTLHHLDPMSEVRAIVRSTPENFPRMLDSFVIRHYLKPTGAKSVLDLPQDKQTELYGVIFTITSERAMNEQTAELKKGHFKVIDENFFALQESYKELLKIKEIANTHDLNSEKEISEFVRKSKNFIRQKVLSSKSMSAKRYSEQESALDALLRLNPTTLSQKIPGTILDPLIVDLLQKIGIQRLQALNLRAQGRTSSDLTQDDLSAYDPLSKQYSDHLLGEVGKN